VQPSWWRAFSLPLGLWDVLYKGEITSTPRTRDRRSNLTAGPSRPTSGGAFLYGLLTHPCDHHLKSRWCSPRRAAQQAPRMRFDAAASGGLFLSSGRHVALARYSGSAHDAVSRCGWNPDYPHSDEAGEATDRDRAASLAA
jgi:hypothetical protein